MNNNKYGKWMGLGWLALIGLPLVAQDPATPPKPGVSPEATAPAEKPADAARVRALIAQLGDAAYKKRRAAEAALEKIGAPALDALREAAAGSDDPEIQWRAERLVQRLEAPSAPDRATLSPRGEAEPRDRGDPFEVTRQFLDRALQDLDRGFPLDDPEWADRIRERMDRQMEELRRFGAGGMVAPGFDGVRRGTSVQVGPDGVRVEVQEPNAEGKLETKVYEAPDMESFHKQHPGVLGGAGLRIGGSPFAPITGSPLMPRFERGQLVPESPFVDRATDGEEPPPPPARRRLGVRVGELDAAVREFLGGGLLVVEVQEGTLAERAGVRGGDVVMRIGERPIQSVADVGDALEAVDPGEEAVIVVNRRGRMHELRGHKVVESGPEGTHGSEPASPEAPAPKGGRGLKPRGR